MNITLTRKEVDEIFTKAIREKMPSLKDDIEIEFSSYSESEFVKITEKLPKELSQKAKERITELEAELKSLKEPS